MRGALQRGLEGPLISHRQSRRHYGIKYWSKFREGIDPESNRIWDEFEGGYKCNNLMSWYLKKGDKVADTKAVSLPWYKTRDLDSDLSCEETDIYCCASDKVPTYKDSGKSFVHIEFVCTGAYAVPPSDTFRLCKLRADLSSIPRSKFERKKSATAGQPERLILNYSIEMTMDSAAISFKLVVDGQLAILPFSSIELF